MYVYVWYVILTCIFFYIVYIDGCEDFNFKMDNPPFENFKKDKL